MTTKTIIAIAAILACLLAPAAIPAAGVPNLPPGAVGYVWTPNADKLFTDADQFLSALGTPNASLIIIKAMLGNLLGNPDLGAVDLKGPLAIVMLNPKENPNPLAACFQVSQPELYLKGMENPPVLKSTDGKSGVKTYARKTSVFDNAAYNAASPAEQSDPSRFYTTAEETFLVIKGTSAWISANPALLDQVKDLSAQDLAAPVTTDLVLVFETELLVKMFREEADKNLAAIAQAGKGAASEEMLRSQLDLYLKYAGQVKRAIFGLTLSKEGIACEKIVEAKPGSTLAAFLSAQKSGELTLARFLDPRAWFVMDYRLRKPEMLLGFYTRMFDLMTAPPPLAEGGEKPVVDQKSRSLYLQSVKALLLEGMGEEAAVGISTAPGELFSAISFQQIKSEEAWKNYIRHGVSEMLPLWKTLSAGQGVTYDMTGAENPVKYKTADVYTVRVRLDKSKIPGKEQMGAAGAWMEQTMTIVMAAAGTTGVTMMSWGGEPKIGPVLNRVSEGKATFDLSRLGPCARDANGVIFVSANDFMQTVLNLLPAGKIEGLRAENLKSFASLDLPLVVCFQAAGETIRASTAVPMEKILAVKKLFENKRAPAPEPAAPPAQPPEIPVPPTAE